MEKRRKKEQERRKSYKGDRHDKMSHVSIISCDHTEFLYPVFREDLASIQVVLVFTREVVVG